MKVNINKKQYFPGSQYYFLMEGEERIMLEQGYGDPQTEKRIRFREEFLNQWVYRISYAHCKIQLLLDVLHDHNNKKIDMASARVTLEEDILKDALQQNLLEMSELITHIADSINSKIHSNFAELLRRIGKEYLQRLDDKAINNYHDLRLFLFPELEKNAVNVPCSAITALSVRIREESLKIKNFRDKVIAHKFDKDRYKYNLTFQDYLEIYNKIVAILDALSVVATLKSNDWNLNQELSKARNWLIRGLDDSISKKNE